MTGRFRTAASTSRGRRRRASCTPLALFSRQRSEAAVELIKKSIKIYPYTPGVRHEHRAALEGKVRLEANPPVPATKFVEASGKVQHDSAKRLLVLRDDQRIVQQEPADSLDPELMGQLAAIGIVKGKPFKPDARMKKILTDAAAVGNAAGRALNWRPQRISRLGLLPRFDLDQHALAGWCQFRDAAADDHQGGLVQTLPAHRRPHARLAHGVLLRLHRHHPGHDHAAARHRLAVSLGLSGCGQELPSTAARPTR